MCNEMKKLRSYLDQTNIKWLDKSEDFGFDNAYMHLTHFEVNGTFVSVINGYGSYGGYGVTTNENKGLLEMLIEKRYDIHGEVIGYLTAKQVMERVKAML